MNIPSGIHIVGASGSGTTTLAAAVSGCCGHRQLDTDHYFWLPSDPPYQTPRPRDDRLSMLQQVFSDSESWVLAGSLCGWGDSLIPEFSWVVFLHVPTEVRVERLKARELERYGLAAISVGGAMHRTHLEFIDWASRYDTGGPEMRSRAMHERWLSALPCPVIRLDGRSSVAENLRVLEAATAPRADAMALDTTALENAKLARRTIFVQ